MERNFYDDDDFEDFLKQKADQYNLYPSDSVWNGIYRALHARRRWYAATGALLLLTTLVFISLEIVSTGYQKAARNIVNDSISSSHSLIASTVKRPRTSSIENIAISIPAAGTTRRKAGDNGFGGSKDLLIPSIVLFPSSQTASLSAFRTSQNNPSPAATTKLPLNAPALLIKNKKAVPEKKKSKEHEINWLQDMATIRLSPFSNKRYHLQFYISPGASYRRLNNYRDFKTTSDVSPLSGDPINVDGVVVHRPAFGLEAGTAVLFNVTDRFILKGGVQLNFVKYNIKAYKSARERTAITLSNMSGGTSPHETITAYSSLRNLGGRFPQDLQNQYLQISLPIGAEFRVLGNKRFQFNIAGTLQPTYLLYNNTYLLTSDYGNYTKQPDLVRKWNVNAALESYISYDFGGLRWQAGPQFRYQLLSTYTDRYPIREYLMEYGIKIGVTKTLR